MNSNFMTVRKKKKKPMHTKSTIHNLIFYNLGIETVCGWQVKVFIKENDGKRCSGFPSLAAHRREVEL